MDIEIIENSIFDPTTVLIIDPITEIYDDESHQPETFNDCQKERWYCYILRNNHPRDKNKTYNGKTNDPIRRLKEHNMIGSKTRGAKHTRKFGNSTWEFIAIIGYFESDVEALRHEWRIKKPEGKKRNAKYVGPKGRIKGLRYALSLERFTKQCEKPLKDMDLNIWIRKEYAHILADVEGLDKLVITECDELNNEYISKYVTQID